MKDRKECTARALARLTALREVFLTGAARGFPVHQRFVDEFHQALVEFADFGVEEFRIAEQELKPVLIRPGRFFLRPRVTEDRYAEWPVFVSRLAAATMYCEYCWDQASRDGSWRQAIGFDGNPGPRLQARKLVAAGPPPSGDPDSPVDPGAR